MIFRPIAKQRLSSKVKGFFASPIQYEVRVPSGDWSPYFGNYEQQKWGGFDSNSCWCLSGINCIEDQLEWLYKNGMFSPEATSFFTTNGYIDSDGDFSLSERFIEILGGSKDKGNAQVAFWQLGQKYGMIPRSMLSYTNTQAWNDSTRDQFIADYFNPKVVTNDMMLLGKQFLKYVTIAYQTIGKSWATPDIQILRAALKQAPVQIGFPIPKNVSNYNYQNPIVYDGSVNADHATELYAIDDKGQYDFYDQYEPHLKVLSSNYLLAICIQGIIIAVAPQVVNPVPQPAAPLNDDWWSSVFQWFNGIKNKWGIQVGSNA